MATVTGHFVVERECKHSVRYQSTDAESKEISSIIYVGRKALEKLGNPPKLNVTLTSE